MPRGGAGFTEHSEVGGEPSPERSGPDIQLWQPSGSPAVPPGVSDVVSPLILTLSRVLDGAPVAVAIPEGDQETPEGGPVLCALPVAPGRDSWGEEFALLLPRALQTATANGRVPLPAPTNGQFPPEAGPMHLYAWPIPLRYGRGVLAVAASASGPAPARVESLSAAFAQSLTAGLRAVYQQQRRERASAALLEVASTAGSTLQLEEVLSLVTERTASLVGADRCGLWLLEKDEQTLVPAALYGMPADYVANVWSQYRTRLDNEPLSLEAIRTGSPVLVRDAPNDPRTDKPSVHFFGDKTILVLPMVAKGQVQGTLFINHIHGHRRYSSGEIETAVAIAGQAAIAVQNARLFREVQEWSNQLQRLQAIMSKLSRSRSVLSIASIVADELRHLIRYDNCTVFMLEEDSNDLVPLAVVSSNPSYSEGELLDVRLPVGQGVTGHVAATGKPQIVGDVERDPRSYHVPGSPVLDESMIATPIIFEGRVIGVITVWRLGLNRFAEADLRLLDIFTSEAAIEFENARLYQETQRKSKELLASFHRVGDALATGLDLDATLQIIVDLAAEMVRVRACAILLVDPSTQEMVVRACRGLPIAVGQVDASPSDSGMNRRVVAEGVPKVIDDISAGDRPSWMTRGGAEDLYSYLGVPLILQGKRIGVLAVFGGRPQQFVPSDVELLSSFGHQAALAVRNAMLYQSVERDRNELDAVISYSSDAILVVDPENRVSRVNAAAESLTGLSADEMVGRLCEEVLFGRFHAGFSKSGLSLQDVVRKRETIPYFEVVVVTKDGTERDVAASYSFVELDGTGSTQGLGVVIARDISKQREVDRMKSDFVSMVSHELRTPLGLIKGYSSTLVNPQLKLDEVTIRRFISGIDAAADRLNRLIENLLSVSRIESGHFRLSTQPVDLVQTVSSAVTAARAMAKEREISMEFPGGGLEVEGDRVQLELVLDNLLGNAIKYSPKAKPIRVRMEQKGDHVEVRVSDEGSGIASHDLSNVFGKFYRVEGVHSVRTPGSGLGLYICRNIIEAHGGRIWVESKLGSGSTFAFSIPMRQEKHPEGTRGDVQGGASTSNREDGDER